MNCNCFTPIYDKVISHKKKCDTGKHFKTRSSETGETVKQGQWTEMHKGGKSIYFAPLNSNKLQRDFN